VARVVPCHREASADVFSQALKPGNVISLPAMKRH